MLDLKVMGGVCILWFCFQGLRIVYVKFFDFVKVYVCLGGGGVGCVLFCCEKFIEYGGFDGGDGGCGGDVWVEVVGGLNMLIDFCFQQYFFVKFGQYGMGLQCIGVLGDDIVFSILVGIEILDEDQEIVIVDVMQLGQCVLLVKGGNGGFGNLYFKSLINCLLCNVNLGLLGVECMLWLCLKLIVDVGLLGLFNVGKLIFLFVVLNVWLKIVDYFFIMLYFNLGVVGVDIYEFVMVDIFGLIEGVFEGCGFGDQFLGYVECLCVFLYLIDGILDDVVGDVCIILNEFVVYFLVLVEKLCIIVLNKIDVMEFDEIVEKQVVLQVELGGKIYLMFGVLCEGVIDVLCVLWLEIVLLCQLVEEKDSGLW